MTQTLAGTKPDVGLHRRHLLRRRRGPRGVPLMRAISPCPRPQRAGRRDDVSGRTRRRAQPGDVLQTRWNPADTPGMPYMIDMDDPSHLLRRKLSRRLHPQRVMTSAVDRHLVRHAHRFGVRARGVRLRPRHRRPTADGGIGRHAWSAARGPRVAAEVVRRPGDRAEFAHRRTDGQGMVDAFAGYTAFTMEIIAKGAAPNPLRTCSPSWSTSSEAADVTTRSSWRPCSS